METINPEQKTEYVLTELKQEFSVKSALLKEITDSTHKLEAELKELQEKSEKAVAIPEQIEILKVKNAELNKEVEDIQSRNAKREAELNALAERTIQEFAHICKEPLYLHAFSSIANQVNSPVLYTEGEKIFGENVVTIENLDIFQIKLSDNLKKYGANSDKTTTMAYDFRQSVEMGKQFIVCGQYGDEFADCISALLTGTSADKIQLTSHENAMCSLISEIQSSTGEVVVIHYALDTLNDSLLLPVVKLCMDKILIYTCTNEKTYSIFPEHWNRYSTFLHPEDKWKQTENVEELQIATCPTLIQLIEKRGKS